MIDLGILAGLLKHDPQLAAYCPASPPGIEPSTRGGHSRFTKENPGAGPGSSCCEHRH